MKSGIYCIRNGQTGHAYLGSSMNLAKRKLEHFNGLRRGDHGNIRLQRAWLKYGEKAFSFEVLEFVHVDDLLSREQAYLDAAFGPHCYNIAPIAYSALGVKWSEDAKKAQSERCLGRVISDETKCKIKEANRGKLRTDAQKERMSSAQMGRVLSATTRAKIAKKATGRPVSEATRAKIAGVHKGRVVSEATRAKMSENSKGNTHFAGRTHTEETKRKIGEGNKGKIITAEQRAAISARFLGRKRAPLTDEQRANMSAAASRRWQAYRESKNG